MVYILNKCNDSQFQKPAYEIDVHKAGKLCYFSVFRQDKFGGSCTEMKIGTFFSDGPTYSDVSLHFPDANAFTEILYNT